MTEEGGKQMQKIVVSPGIRKDNPVLQKIFRVLGWYLVV